MESSASLEDLRLSAQTLAQNESLPSSVMIKDTPFLVTREEQDHACLIILKGTCSTHYFTIAKQQEQTPKAHTMTRNEFKTAYDAAPSAEEKKELVIRLARQIYGEN